MRNKTKVVSLLFFISVVLTGCRTIPEDPSAMTCDDLNSLAEESLNSSLVPFFITQVVYPADWRNCSDTENFIEWVQNNSRRRVLLAKKDWGEITTLKYDKKTKVQDTYKVRALVSQCTNPPKNKEIDLIYSEFPRESNSRDVTVKAKLNGKNPEDRVARILCGYENYPDKSKYDTMAQKWKQCQSAPAKK